MYGRKQEAPRATLSTTLVTVASAALIASAVLVACGGSASETGWSTVRDTLPSGAIRVTNVPPANIASAEAPPTWTLVEELRVGTVEGDGPAAFAYIKGLVVLDDGRFAVLDSQAQELRVFGSDGAHLATHGGRGEGPGEFSDANGLMLDPEGRIRVPDARNGRVSVFDPEEGFVESFPFGDGNFNWIWDGVMVGDRIFRPWSSGTRSLLRVYDLTMTLVDSLPLPDDGPEGEEYDPTSVPGAFYQETGSGYMMRAIPFYPHEVRYIGARGDLWSATEGDPAYRIRKWRPGGDTTLVFETRRPAVPVTAAERDSVIAPMREMLSNLGVGEWDWSRIPSIKPAVEDIFESSEGHLWVRTPSTGGGVLFDVYSGDGAYLGSASLGPGAGSALDLFAPVAPVVRGDLVWLVLTDELDVPYVVRSRIAPAGRNDVRIGQTGRRDAFAAGTPADSGER